MLLKGGSLAAARASARILLPTFRFFFYLSIF